VPGLQIGLCELGGEVMETNVWNRAKQDRWDQSYVDCTQTGSVWLPACSVMRKGRKFGLVVETNNQSINKEKKKKSKMPYRKRLPPASGR
jgi:hypothetical protein